MGDHRDDRDAINGENTVYLAELHTRWQHDPSSVDTAFASLFETLGSDRLPLKQPNRRTPTLKASNSPIVCAAMPSQNWTRSA